MKGRPTRFQAVIFDLDGTLVDTLEDLANTTNIVLLKHGQPTHSVEAYRTLVGDGVAVLFERAWPATRSNAVWLQQAVADFQAIYAQHWHNRSKPYDGILDLINRLRSCSLPLAVLSNKPDPFTQLCIQHFFPAKTFEAVRGQRPDIPKKPDPAGVYAIASELKLRTEDIAYVGDTNTDMETAVSAGCCAIGVSWGFRAVAELKQSGAAYVFDSPDELGDFLVG
jgi:phosphoglycolate phosphatase